MRNLKKILALALALVMTLSLMTVANAFNDDKDIDAKYDEAVTVLSNLKVFKGVNDGSNFAPKQTITRAEVAAIIYRIVTGDVADNQAGIYKDYAKFKDVAANHWAAGYIGYCSNAELILGDGTNFYPDQTVTGYQALAMILRAVGYDKNNEFQGNGWEIRTASTAQGLGILKNINQGTLGTAATREMVAEVLFQAILVPTVTYTPALGYSQYVSIVGGTKNDSLGYKTFKLLVNTAREDDVWGRPSTVWKLDTAATFGCWSTPSAGDKTLVSIQDTPIKSYTTAVTECDVAADYGFQSSKTFDTYTNGKINKGTDTLAATNTVAKIGAQGRLTEVYADRIVYIDTLLASVTNVTNATFDAAGHLRTPATITLAVYDTNTTASAGGNGSPVVSTTTATTVTLNNGAVNYTYTAGQMVLVNAVQYTTGRVRTLATEQHVDILGVAQSMAGAQSVIWYNASQHTINNTVYNDNNRFHLDQAGIETSNHTWYFDSYGNLIGATDLLTQYTYGVVTNIYWQNNAGVGSAYANITYMDGTTASAVKVASIDMWQDTPTNSYAQDCVPVYALSGNALNVTIGTPNTVGISTWSNDNNYKNGTFVNNDMFRISTLADGSIVLDAVDEMTQATIKTGVSWVGGTASKGSTATNIYTNANTQYLVKNANGTFTALTGFNSIYNYTTGTKATVDYVVGADGYVTYAFVTGTPDAATNSKLVYVTSNNYATYLDANRITHYVVTAVDIEGKATTVDTTDFNVVATLVTGVNKVFYVTYTGDNATATTEITTAATGVPAYGATMSAIRLNGATVTGGVLSDLAFANRYNVTNATVFQGDLTANMADRVVYVVYDSATAIAKYVYVSALPNTAAGNAKLVTWALPGGEVDVKVVSAASVNVAPGQTVTVALYKSSNTPWGNQGDNTYTVTATGSASGAWVVSNVRTDGGTMTFDVTAPAGLTTNDTVTFSW